MLSALAGVAFALFCYGVAFLIKQLVPGVEMAYVMVTILIAATAIYYIYTIRRDI